jgi:hypothetical protein
MKSIQRQILALAAVGVAAGACKDSMSLKDPNAPDLASVSGALTPANLQTLVTGVLDEERRSIDYPFLVFPGTLARDIVRLDNSESRFESETLEGPPSSGGFLSRGFTPYFAVIRAENNLLATLPHATAELTGPGHQGDTTIIAGFIRTLKANDFYTVLATRDTIGLPIAVENPDQVAPIRCKPTVLAYLSALLDTGYTELRAAQAAGTTTLPVQLPGGFTSNGDYSDVANLIKFNRGLKGKIEVYRGLAGNGAQSFTDAITALNIALADIGSTPSAADLAMGPYYQFSSSGSDAANPLFDSRIHFTNSVGDSIQPGDKRASKIITRTSPAILSVDEYEFNLKYDPAVTVTSNPANQVRSIPILKNEELILLRAQAKIGLNQLAAAQQDINIVRTVSGGLAPYTAPFASQTAAINALLYEKRYSLLTDGPQRLVDLRAYGRLNATSFPATTTDASGATIQNPLSPYPGDPFNKVLPLPQAEIDARSGNVACVM